MGIKFSLMLLFAALCGIQCVQAANVPPRQTYPLDPEAVESNAARVAQDLAGVDAEWKNAPVLYYTVEPMSDIKRLPDLYPEDGKLAAPLDIVAAKGEFEPASFVVYPKKNVDQFELEITELKNKEGDVIPVSQLDLKLVKIWYQCGSGWFGFMADPLGRTLTPELLLNDEKLILADPSTQDNYARYSNADGSTNYEWISADFMVTNYQFTNMVRIAMMHDADTLQPVVLNRDEFKQFMLTVHVPDDTRSGVYTGSITMKADGEKVGMIPVSVCVLPFTLPKPATNYDISKPFMIALYGTGDVQDHPNIIKNLVNHNATYLFGFPKLNPKDEEQFAKEVELAKELGVSLRPLFANGPGVHQTVYGKEPNAEALGKLNLLEEQLEATAALCEKYLGHTDFYCYGVDEGSYDTIKAERPAWRAAHAAGAKVMVSTRDHERMLYSLDFMIMPGMPSKERAEKNRKFHEAHPNGLVGWYANPHSGPENPDYFRRINGLMAYKADYDVNSNYAWYRNDWNDFAIAYESNYRGLIMVYAISDRVLDTLAWEGVREGLDDVRYATKLRQLAQEAEESGNVDALLIGRKALAYLAYWDSRENPDTFRMECANYIMQLEKELHKEQN